jgi:hypothetical protein
MVVREMIATARERIAKLREAEKWWARVVEPRGSASEEPEAQHIERGSTHGVGWLRHVAWTLNLLLMKKKNRMSDSLLLWE